MSLRGAILGFLSLEPTSGYTLKQRFDGSVRSLEPLLREILYGSGVAAVEWFDRLPADAGEEALRVTLRHVAGDRRALRLEARGVRHERWRPRSSDHAEHAHAGGLRRRIDHLQVVVQSSEDRSRVP